MTKTNSQTVPEELAVNVITAVVAPVPIFPPPRPLDSNRVVIFQASLVFGNKISIFAVGSQVTWGSISLPTIASFNKPRSELWEGWSSASTGLYQIDLHT